MSAQFGRWNFDGRPIDPEYIEKVDAFLAPYGPDAVGSHSAAGFCMLYHAFHTTKESRRERQPHVFTSGAVITWDGRLDNRTELIRDLAHVLTVSSTDVEIVAAAFEEWGESCFAKLIGDWALSVWRPDTRSVLLAKDPIGTRHLYYAFDESLVTWSTILDPLVLLAGRRFQVCEEYIAGWLGFFPAAHLTPYIGIDSVPPSSFVRLRSGKREIHKYWDFDPRKRIRYHIDAEYEEHFRTVFAEAVRRRLRSDSPILAELSGGMDSSSIVCMADEMIARGLAETSCLDTVSYYDDSEPNWNERPYFAKVEEKRGRVGCHIDVGPQTASGLEFRSGKFAATPDISAGRCVETSQQFAAYLTSQGNRALLSGLGGDEVMGGVPTPTPELLDLLARARLGALARRLKVWALNKRKPWVHLFFEAARGLFPPDLVGVPKQMRPPPWSHPSLVKRHRPALTGYLMRVKLFGPLPSFQENLSTLESVRRQLACSVSPSEPTIEKRCPYLDRDLLEFMFAIPPDQVLRPHERRSLMRRALVGIVPEELLARKRKAFVIRSPITLSMKWASLFEGGPEMLSSRLGIIDVKSLRAAAQRAREGREIPAVALMRTMVIESWLVAISADDNSVVATRNPLHSNEQTGA